MLLSFQARRALEWSDGGRKNATAPMTAKSRAQTIARTRSFFTANAPGQRPRAGAARHRMRLQTRGSLRSGCSARRSSFPIAIPKRTHGKSQRVGASELKSTRPFRGRNGKSRLVFPVPGGEGEMRDSCPIRNRFQEHLGRNRGDITNCDPTNRVAHEKVCALPAPVVMALPAVRKPIGHVGAEFEVSEPIHASAATRFWQSGHLVALEKVRSNWVCRLQQMEQLICLPV